LKIVHCVCACTGTARRNLLQFTNKGLELRYNCYTQIKYRVVEYLSLTQGMLYPSVETISRGLKYPRVIGHPPDALDNDRLRCRVPSDEPGCIGYRVL